MTRSEPGSAKALSHVVSVSPGGFLVRSGSSGQIYLVVPQAGGAACDCSFGQHNPAPHLCSHVRAVMIFAEQQKETQ